MARWMDYDEARTSEPIRIKVRGEVYEYPAEAPVATAIEWMSRMAAGTQALGESAGEYMVANYNLILGEKNYAEMAENKAGAGTVDAVYRDLLDWWGLWVKPPEFEHDVELLLTRVEMMAIAGISDPDTKIQVASAFSELRSAVQAILPDDDEEVDADDESEALAGNPA